MAKIGIFFDRRTLASSTELEALMRFRKAVEGLGHEGYFFMRGEIDRIPTFDAIFIRALTDPANMTYVVARLAELHGIPVIDDSASIRICCDKINMYLRLQEKGILMPATKFLDQKDLNLETAATIFSELGSPVVVKAPNSSFSRHVEKAETPEEFLKKSARLFYRSDTIVAQKFIRSEFDWRVGVLGGEPLYICRYTIPQKTFKIHALVDGHQIAGNIESISLVEADPAIVAAGVAAANAIGSGLYGVDLKEADGQIFTIEVNDNPTIEAGGEDRDAPELYSRIASRLLKKSKLKNVTSR